MRYTVADPDQALMLSNFADLLTFVTCRVCGCSDMQACAMPCGWAEPDLCTNCVGHEDQARTVHGQAMFAGRHGRS